MAEGNDIETFEREVAVLTEHIELLNARFKVAKDEQNEELLCELKPKSKSIKLLKVSLELLNEKIEASPNPVMRTQKGRARDSGIEDMSMDSAAIEKRKSNQPPIQETGAPSEYYDKELRKDSDGESSA